ncbi:amidohydrolase [Candidatus Bathyarchaeota archaeon]|nr:amidohydrolase [Candidatus Bathyarchaeota archaeon]
MVDILIRNGIVVTMDKEKRIFKDGALAIEGDGIIDVGSSVELEKKYSPNREIDARGKVILPGLINTHTHLFQNLLKGMRDDLPLVDWINTVTMPHIKAAFQDALAGDFEIGYYGALLGCIEALKSGTTCLLDMDLRNPRTPAAFKETGIRGIYAIALADKWVTPEVLVPKEEMMQMVNQIINKWHDSENGRIQCMLGPSAPFNCSEELLQEIRELADKNGMNIHIHVSETKYECDLIKKETNKRPLEFLYDLGFLGSDVSAAHCVWVSDKEIDLLKKTGTKVSHNPESNMKLASGVAPIPKMLKKRITVSLGTDGCASNDNLDMFEAMRITAFLHKVSSLDASIISAYDVLKMATIDGAKTIGLEDQIGSLEVGKKADVILVDLQKAHLRPLHDIVNILVYCARGGDVETVIVDGKIVVENGAIKTVNERNIIQETEKRMTGRYNA